MKDEFNTANQCLVISTATLQRAQSVPCVPPGIANHARATKHDPCAPCTHQTNCHYPKCTVLCSFHSGRQSYVSIRQYTGGVRAEGLGGATARPWRAAVQWDSYSDVRDD